MPIDSLDIENVIFVKPRKNKHISLDVGNSLYINNFQYPACIKTFSSVQFYLRKASARLLRFLIVNRTTYLASEYVCVYRDANVLCCFYKSIF